MDRDWLTVKRIGEVLGANDAARLHTALVKSAGVASGVLVNLEDSAGPNLLTAQLIVSPGKDAAQAENLVHQEIQRIARDGVPKEELQRLETDALRRRAFSLITTTSRANVFAGFLTGYGKLDAVNDWEQNEHRVTNEDIRRVARKYFAPSNRTVLTVMPGSGGKP
jgi:zinc protease